MSIGSCVIRLTSPGTKITAAIITANAAAIIIIKVKLFLVIFMGYISPKIFLLFLPNFHIFIYIFYGAA